MKSTHAKTNMQTWSLLILSTIPEHMACTGVWLKYSLCYFIEKKKTNKLIFPSLSSCQLQITSWLEVGHWDYFLLSVLRFLSKLNLHKSSAWCHSLWRSYVNQPCCVWKRLLLLACPELKLFLCPLYREHWALSLIKTSHLVLSTPQSLTLCTLCRCESLY